MIDAERNLSDAVEGLQREFDETFAAPLPEPGPKRERLLAIRISGDPYAVRVSEVAAVAKPERLVRFPAKQPEFLGVASVRGSIFPVYSLAAIVAPGTADPASAWILLCDQADPLGLAFQSLEGSFDVPSAELAASSQASNPYVTGMVRWGSTSRPVIQLSSAVRRLKARKARGGSSKEEV